MEVTVKILFTRVNTVASQDGEKEGLAALQMTKRADKDKYRIQD